MATFNTSDIIFATVTQHGQTILSLQMSGLSSFAELLKKLRNAIINPIGLVTLKLRNSSQGWAQQHTMILTTAPKSPTRATQLTLF